MLLVKLLQASLHSNQINLESLDSCSRNTLQSYPEKSTENRDEFIFKSFVMLVDTEINGLK